MKIAEIAHACCEKIGKTDTAAIAKAKQFVRQQIAVLWHRHLWKDSRTYETVAVTAGASIVVMPETVEIVLGVTWANGQLLQQMDAETIMQINPQEWDRLGQAVVYERLPKNASGLREVKLVARPKEAGSLLVLGKRPVPTLDDADQATDIVGADTMLLCLVEAELLEWQRQYGKAQAKRTEAWNIHWPAMLNAEKHQAAQQIRLLPHDQAYQDRESWDEYAHKF